MKLTTKQLKQIIKEELRLVMENERDYDKMSADIRKVFKSPEMVKSAEILLGSAYDLNFKLVPNKAEKGKSSDGGEIYSDDLKTMEVLMDALSACDAIECAEMSAPQDLHSEKMKRFTNSCKESYRYMAYYYFDIYK